LKKFRPSGQFSGFRQDHLKLLLAALLASDLLLQIDPPRRGTRSKNFKKKKKTITTRVVQEGIIKTSRRRILASDLQPVCQPAEEFILGKRIDQSQEDL
jgi:hypothetical protein